MKVEGAGEVQVRAPVRPCDEEAGAEDKSLERSLDGSDDVTRLTPVMIPVSAVDPQAGGVGCGG